jgi:hypothetical protein
LCPLRLAQIAAETVIARRLLESDLVIDRSKLPVNLKQLYKMFPEIKRSGVPQGYPRGKGLAVVKKWCQDKATQMIIDREHAPGSMRHSLAIETGPPSRWMPAGSGVELLVVPERVGTVELGRAYLYPDRHIPADADKHADIYSYSPHSYRHTYI